MADKNNDTPSTPIKNSNAFEGSSGCSTSGYNTSPECSASEASETSETSASDPGISEELLHTERLTNVKRRLDFGESPEDRNTKDESEESLALPLCDETEREKLRRKWNFDFENEVPLEGQWEWEKVPTLCPRAQDVVSAMRVEKHRNV